MKSKYSDDPAYDKEINVTEEGIHSDPAENLDTGKRKLCSRGELEKMDTDDDEILDYCSHYGIMNVIASCAHCNPGIYLDYITVSRACDDQTFPPNPGEKQNLLEQYEERTAAVRFEHRVLVKATAVNIVGERCSEDIKEILTKPVDNDGDVRWEKEAANHWHIGKYHLVMDPYEKKSAYVANMPDWWDYPVLDVLERYRSIYQLRTTLGHKANPLFEGKNTEYDTVNQPVHGDIVCYNYRG